MPFSLFLSLSILPFQKRMSSPTRDESSRTDTPWTPLTTPYLLTRPSYQVTLLTGESGIRNLGMIAQNLPPHSVWENCLWGARFCLLPSIPDMAQSCLHPGGRVRLFWVQHKATHFPVVRATFSDCSFIFSVGDVLGLHLPLLFLFLVDSECG